LGETARYANEQYLKAGKDIRREPLHTTQLWGTPAAKS
jgi:hypothetical protein